MLQRDAGNRAVSSLISRGAVGGATLQRAADSGQESAIRGRANAVAAEAEKAKGDHDDAEGPPKIDPAEKEKAKGEQQGNFAQPDRVSAPASQVEQAATATQSEVAAPTQPVGEKGPAKPAEAPAATPAEAGAAATAEATGRAQALLAEAQALPEPEVPEEVEPPPLVMPLDADGAPLPIDPAGEQAVGIVAGQIAQLRFGAHSLAVDATANRAQSHALRAALVEARGQIDEATGSIETVHGHVEHRRTVAEQATTALGASKEKAEKVASEAPGVASKADEGQQSSSPMAGEAGNLSSSGPKPDDQEAAAKADEQGGQITKVSGSLTSIDSAIGQAGTRARTLQADAAQAKAGNAASESTITETHATLDKTDGKLNELTAQNETARAEIAGMAERPDEIAAGAAAQQEDAAAILDQSRAYEARLVAVQQDYASELQGIPGLPPRPERPAGGAGPGLQRAPAPERVHIKETDDWARVISGEEEESQAQRTERAAKAQKKQQEELAEINEHCKDGFSKLGAGEKAGLALKLTFSRTFGGIGDTNWPKFGKDLLRGFIDPRVSLSGIVSGLGMIASGEANLLSREQWARDPLGNLLKSTADIATGVTIVFGSIAGLAVAIIAISAALILLSWGVLAPALLPVITFCSTVAATVGPWAVTAAEVALTLNALVFIKNLIDAATASTAEELQQKSMAMGEDVAAMGTAAMQIAGDKLGKKVGPKIGGALEGVQGRLANSGTSVGAMAAKNMGKIGAAMSAGHGGAPTAPHAAPAVVETGAATVTEAAPAAPPAEARPAPVAEAPPRAAGEHGAAPEPTALPEPAAAPEAAVPAEAVPGEAAPPEAPEPPRMHDGQPVVAEATAAEGKAKVEVMGDGECRVCASPCTKVADKFPDAIKEPELAGKIEAAMALEDPQAQANAVAEIVPELEQAQATAGASAATEPTPAGDPSPIGAGGPDQPGLPPDFEVPDDFTFTAEGPLVEIPVDPSGAPAQVLEIGAGPTDTNLGLPPEPGQGNLSAHDASLVDVTRSDLQPRPGVVEINATQPIPAEFHGQDAVIVNNPRGYRIDVGTIGEAVRPGGRIVIQGRAEVVPGMRGINPDMNPILQQAVVGEVPPGYRVVEVVTLPDVPSGNPTAVPKPGDVLGGPFQRTTGPPVSWPNTRIIIERLPL